jgi:hypothetical protein
MVELHGDGRILQEVNFEYVTWNELALVRVQLWPFVIFENILVPL